MNKKQELSYPTPKRGLPFEFKYDFAMRGYANCLKGFFYVIREEFGAETALRLYEKLCNMDDRIKNLTKTLLKIFKLTGNDAETIGKVWNLWWELTGKEGTILERSKTIDRTKITKCPWRTAFKDISDWGLIWCNIVAKTVNPKATVERPKAMCAGDPHCEYLYKVEE